VCAGLDWGFTSTVESPHPGFSVQVAGYVDKMPRILDHILARMSSFNVQAERFDIMKEKFAEFFANWDHQPPYAWCSRLADEVLQSGAAPRGLQLCFNDHRALTASSQCTMRMPSCTPDCHHCSKAATMFCSWSCPGCRPSRSR
jgi:Middle or third domain of peptidase_M16